MAPDACVRISGVVLEAQTKCGFALLSPHDDALRLPMNLWLLTALCAIVLLAFWRVLMYVLDQIADALEQMSAPTEPRTLGAEPVEGQER